jgi:PAS domain S-box-containing protein
MLEATHGYVLLLMLAAAVSAACAGGFLLEAPERLANRLAAVLLGGASFWALCEVAWNLTPDPQSALFWMRLSTAGWIFIGPVVLHIVLSAFPRRRPALKHLMRALYAVSAILLIAGWTTDLLIVDAMAASWGNAYRVGPIYPFFYLATMAGVIPGVYIALSTYRGFVSQAERRQRPFALVGVLTPFFVASITDVLLPILDVQVPRLGTTSFAVLGAVAAANLVWYGHSFLSPGSFAEEILATLSDGVVLLYRSNRIRSANPAIARISGYSPAELTGMNLQKMLTGSLPSPGPDSEIGFETHLIRSSGDRVPVSVATSELCDRHGLSIGLVVVVRDLREVYELRHRLVTSARLAAVGELAAGIAHEINNPIAYVRANLTQLQDHWKTVQGEVAGAGQSAALGETFCEADELLLESLEGVDRAAEIVRGVKGFAHAGPSTRELTDINRLLDDVLRMAAPELRNRVTIERCFSKLQRVVCSPQELKQVFLNLVLNAGQALETSGNIWVSTEWEEDGVVVRVEDDGPGIPTEILDRIFDPFFTTKKVGEGTGLGLGIAYQIIRAHGGEISAASEPGRGAAFTVRLPAVPADATS